jgi:hypothetical protein
MPSPGYIVGVPLSVNNNIAASRSWADPIRLAAQDRS